MIFSPWFFFRVLRGDFFDGLQSTTIEAAFHLRFSAACDEPPMAAQEILRGLRLFASPCVLAVIVLAPRAHRFFLGLQHAIVVAFGRAV